MSLVLFLQNWCHWLSFEQHWCCWCFLTLVDLVVFLHQWCHRLLFASLALLVLFIQHWCSWSLLLRNCCCWLFFAALLFWSASSGPALTLPLCGNPTTSKAAALSKSHAIEVFSFPELQQPTTQQTPTTQLLCSNLTPSKVLSKVSLILLLWPTLLEPSWVSTWTWTCKNLPKNRHIFYQLVSTTFHLRGESKLAQSMVDT